MVNLRRSYSAAEELALTTQVGGYCPLCGASLFYVKKSRSYKEYEIAHIYPLNPTREELEELKGVALLHSDINHPDNLLPLCTKCHTRLDKPRTREEYESIFNIKRRLIEQAEQRNLNGSYPLEIEIQQIVKNLGKINFDDLDGSELELDPKSLFRKFDDSLSSVTQRKIKHAVSDYYLHIKEEFKNLELANPNSSQLIYTQVRLYYLKQKSLDLPQSTIFLNVVDWLARQTVAVSPEAAEIVASFFIQNCEVFE
jgi:hypothetical protein